MSIAPKFAAEVDLGFGIARLIRGKQLEEGIWEWHPETDDDKRKLEEYGKRYAEPWQT